MEIDENSFQFMIHIHAQNTIPKKQPHSKHIRHGEEETTTQHIYMTSTNDNMPEGNTNVMYNGTTE